MTSDLNSAHELNATADSKSLSAGSWPLVSVIIPAYNCARYIAQAITSVLAQDYEPLEVIVINDGSTDQTLDIAASFVPAITLVSQENRGPSAARNRGLALAKGAYIAFLDGDDYWMPGKLFEQVEYLNAHPELSVVHGGFFKWQPNAQGEFPNPAEFMRPRTSTAIDHELSGWIYHRLLLDSEVHIITALIRSSVIQEIGNFDESLTVGEDYEFWLRVSRRYEMHKLARPLALYRFHDGNTTTEPRPVSFGYLVLKRAVDKWGLAGPDGRSVAKNELNNRMAQLCFNFGYLHFWRGDRKVARNEFKKTLAYRPWWIKNLGYLAWSTMTTLSATSTKRRQPK